MTDDEIEALILEKFAKVKPLVLRGGGALWDVRAVFQVPIIITNDMSRGEVVSRIRNAYVVMLSAVESVQESQ